jgi:hypothetical protein
LTNGLLSEIDGFDVRRPIRLLLLLLSTLYIFFLFLSASSFPFMVDDDDGWERLPQAYTATVILFSR